MEEIGLNQRDIAEVTINFKKRMLVLFCADSIDKKAEI